MVFVTNKRDTPFLDSLTDVLPYRYQSGLSGAWFRFVNGVMEDTINQILTDALMARLLKTDNSPDDILEELAGEFGQLRYAGEDDGSFRQRIIDFWNTVPSYGHESALKNVLETAGFGSKVTVNALITGPETDIKSIKSRKTIQQYPDQANYWSEFLVTIQLPEIRGSGSESNLVTDKQLETVRSFIELIKPVDWVCREIIMIHNPDEVPIYDGSQNYGDSNFEWAVSPDDLKNFKYERHPV